MYRNILVPLDGSRLAEKALPEAMKLGSVSEPTYLLLRVVQPRLSTGSPYLPHMVEINRQDLEDRQAEATAYLEQVAERIAGETGRPVEHFVVIDIDVARAILEVARDRGADVIVMASHGRTGFRRAVLGSVANEVLRDSHLPILLVRGSDE